METYPKIHTIYKRDPGNRNKTLLEDQYSLPEFEYLANNEWVFTEKVDGTNIRIMWENDRVTFGGKTDNAAIPATLTNCLRDTFPDAEKFVEAFPDVAESFRQLNPIGVCLYGEGYGSKIQKGGGKYRPDQDFVLFDVLLDGWWLRRDDVVDVASKMGLGVVPEILRGTLDEGVALVRGGFDSAWGDFQAEGVVAKPFVEMKTRGGEPIITKIKCRDFS